MQKTSVFEVVTQQILKLLEEGTIPWHQNWQWHNGLPQNFDSKRPYSGFNLLYLSALQLKYGWEYPYYLTLKKINARGWRIQKGEKGNLVVFWKATTISEVEEDTGEVKKKTHRVLRYYWVWNVAQLVGPTPADFPDRGNDNKPLMDSEELISKFVQGLPEIKVGPPSYSPKQDIIFLPKLSDFKNPESYYGTRFHETIHATGAGHRLNRQGVAGAINFGSDTYSLEELIAEMGAAFLSALSGISPENLKDHAAYVQAWLHKLKDNPTWVVKAAAQAQKAVNYLLNEEDR